MVGLVVKLGGLSVTATVSVPAHNLHFCRVKSGISDEILGL